MKPVHTRPEHSPPDALRGRAGLAVIGVLCVVAGLLWVLAGLDARRDRTRPGAAPEDRGAESPLDEAGRRQAEAEAAELLAARGGGAGRGAAGGPDRTGAGDGPGSRGRVPAARSGPEGDAVPAPATDMVWSLRVKSVDAPGGVAGAELELRGGGRLRRATTDDEGEARIAWYAGLPTALALTHAEYLDLRDPEVDLEQPGDYRLIRSATLEVELTGVTPTGPALVHLWHVRDPRVWGWHELVATATDGRARFEDLEPGEYALTAEAPGTVAPFEQGLALVAGELLVRELLLAEPALVLGRVLELESGAPVVGALLRVEPRKGGLPKQLRRIRRLEVETDAEGAFALDGVAPGSHRVQLELPWLGREVHDLDVGSSGEQVELVLEVQAPAPVGGRVFDAEGDAAPGARVVAVPRHERGSVAELVAGAEAGRDPTGDHWVTTDADGDFQFELLPTGEALTLLAFARGGGAPGRASLPSRGAGLLGPREVVIELPPPLAVEGRVRDLGGEHLAGARIEHLAPIDGKRASWGTTHSAEDGRYRLEGLRPGLGTLEVTLSGYLRTRVPLELVSDEQQEVDVELVKALVLRGVARDRDGLAVANVRVRLRPDPDRLESFRGARGLQGRDLARLKYATRTNRDGEFRFEKLEPLDWVPEIDALDWELARATPRVLGPEDREAWTLTLDPAGRDARATLRATVVSADDGAPVVGLRVSGLKGAAYEVDGGELRVTGVAPGTTRLTLAADGFAPLRLPPVELLAGEDRDLGRLELEPGTRLTVRVRSAAGKPVTGATVRLRSLPVPAGGTGQGVWLPKPKELGGGRYRWEAVPRAAFTLVVKRAGFRILREPLIVQDEPSQQRSVALQPKGG